jgi:hypothetical protein
MDILEVKKKQKELDLELSRILSEKIEQFRRETGVSIKGANVTFYNATSYSDVLPVYISGEIETTLAF